HEAEVVAADVLDVEERAGLERVDADHSVPALEQRVAEVRSEEAGPAGDHAGGHAAVTLHWPRSTQGRCGSARRGTAVAAHDSRTAKSRTKGEHVRDIAALC